MRFKESCRVRLTVHAQYIASRLRALNFWTEGLSYQGPNPGGSKPAVFLKAWFTNFQFDRVIRFQEEYG